MANDKKSDKEEDKKKENQRKRVLGWGMAERARRRIADRQSEVDATLDEIQGKPKRRKDLE